MAQSSVKSRIENLQLHNAELQNRIVITAALAAGVSVTPEEAAVYLGKSTGYLAVLRHEKKGPAFTLSGVSVRYSKTALDDWLASCKLQRVVSPNVGRPSNKDKRRKQQVAR